MLNLVLMTMKFKVTLAIEARVEVRDIVIWLRSRSQAGAKTWRRRWEKVITALEEHADSCGLAPEADLHGQAIYQIIFQTRQGLPYRALFLIRGNSVSVIHVRGSGQDLVTPDEIGG